MGPRRWAGAWTAGPISQGMISIKVMLLISVTIIKDFLKWKVKDFKAAI